MEKSQYELVMEVIREFDEAGLLDDLILIGSWAVLFYREYFDKKDYSYTLRTRDIDFALQRRAARDIKVNIPELLKKHGFITNLLGSKGVMKLQREDFMLEFIVPEIGRGSEEPLRFHNLGINAQQLRYINMLVDHTVYVKVDGVKIRLTHPAAYALHKFIIFKRRLKKDKAQKDLESAVYVFDFLLKSGDKEVVINMFKSYPAKWQKTIITNLEKVGQNDIAVVLKG